MSNNMPNFELTTAESERLETLQKKLEVLEKHHKAISANYITGAQVNPAGDIGSIRSRSKRQKERIWNRYDKQAKETVEHVNKRDSLKRQIAQLEQSTERRKKRFMLDMIRLKVWDALKVGDTFPCGNGELEIKKKNRFSVITLNGTKWTISELTGLSRKRIDELRSYLD